MAVDLPPLKYGYVKARFTAGVGESTGSPTTPDVIPLSGTVTFNLSAGVIRVQTALPVPTTVYPQPITADVDADGYLTWNDARLLPLLATDDPAMNPMDLQWTVSFDLRTPDGYKVPSEPWRFVLPAGETVDLTDVAPLTSPAPNTVIVKGDKGDPGPNTIPAADYIGSEVARVGSPAWEAVQAAAAAVNTTYPLRSFLLPDEVFPQGSASLYATALFNRAMAQLRTVAAADPLGRTHLLSVPAGTFRLNSPGGDSPQYAVNLVGDAPNAENIGVVGEGSGKTFLVVDGTVSAFGGARSLIDPATPQDFFWFDNVHFSGMTIDMRATPFPSVGFQKAFVGGAWRDASFRDVRVIGATGTAFGTDYPVNVRYIDCHVVDAGRGTVQPVGSLPYVYGEARSGFGIGFGHKEKESIYFLGCTVMGGANSGFFFERQDSRGGMRRDSVIVLDACTARYCGNGLTDAGCGGVIATGCDFSDNRGAGFYSGINTQAKAGGIRGQLTDSVLQRNGYGFYATGTIQDFPADQPIDVAGGYVLTGNRIQDNLNDGIALRDFELEAGGLDIEHNKLVRNGGAGIRLVGARRPLRSLRVEQNDLDGNAAGGLLLLVPMNAPQIVGNDFANSDGVARQLTAMQFHAAEWVSKPRVQRNVFRQMVNEVVGASRFDQTFIGSNTSLAAAQDPATDQALYFEYLQAKPDATLLQSLGPGWSAAWATPNWTRNTGGALPTSGTWGQVTAQYRTFESSGLYVEATLPATSQAVGQNRFRGVALSVTDEKGLVFGADDVSTQFGALTHLALWKVIGAAPVLVWESTVDGREGHKVALARLAGSTVTNVYIDGVLAHTQDIPDVPAVKTAGIAAASGPGGTVSGTPSSRVIRTARFLPFVAVDGAPPATAVLRNKALNPSFEATGGGAFAPQWGTGGAGSATRENNSANAHSGSYSYLMTWTTASTDPIGGGLWVTGIEAVEVGEVYTPSIWVYSSTERAFRLNVTYFAGANGTGSSTGSKNGAYVTVPANTWTLIYTTTGAMPAGTVSMRMAVSAQSLAAGGANFQVGETLRFDDYMVPKGEQVVTGNVNDGTWTWTGPVNASATTKVVTV